MKKLINVAFGVALLAFACSVMAGAPNHATAAQAADLDLTLPTGGGCGQRIACNKLNRYAIKSTLLVRQLLAQSGISTPNAQ